MSLKKEYKLTYEDLTDEEREEGVWLETGDGVIKLPRELLPYLKETDILGIA